VVFGLVAVVAALSSEPSVEDQLAADARRQLFIPEEDDMKAVERGVNRMNLGTQAGCAK
jgi:hypothetical protein